MKVEILFTTLGILRVDVDDAYESDHCLCVQLPSGLVRHFPWCHVWSWTCQHRDHAGSTRGKAAEAAKERHQ
jgi:hypothetical protein